MSRIAPTIPVDLNSRRVLVDDLATRLPRCDCCPDGVTCAECDQPALLPFDLLSISALADFRPFGQLRLIDNFFVQSESERHSCVDDRTAFSDVPFPDDQPFISANGFIQLGFPGGGVVTAMWSWLVIVGFQAVEFPVGRPDRALIIPARVTLHVIQIGSVDDPAVVTAVAYAISLDAGTITSFLATDINWFEHGFLPPQTSPCRPDIFPLVLDLATVNPPVQPTPQHIRVRLGGFA